VNDTWNLYGSTRHSHDGWSQLHDFAHDWTAAWADNDGFHLDPMPGTVPLATHLWAWTTGRWLRVRIDTPYWWAALLTVGPSVDLPWQRKEIEKPRIDASLHWSKKDGRVQQYRGSDGVLDGKAVQLIVNRPTTAPFIGWPDSLPEELRATLPGLAP
jgi:hypothetical protein